MTYYLGLRDGQNCFGSRKAVLEWFGDRKYVIIEPPKDGYFRCVIIKEPGIKGESFSADTYRELMGRVYILCNN